MVVQEEPSRSVEREEEGSVVCRLGSRSPKKFSAIYNQAHCTHKDGNTHRNWLIIYMTAHIYYMRCIMHSEDI